LDFLGIDVGKKDIHAAFLQGDRSSTKSVPNSATGIKQLIVWIKNRKAENVHACLESTGGWSEAVAFALHEADYSVSIVNPCRIKAFAQSVLLRTKTDAVDAGLIARFCQLHKPELWSPPTPEVLALQNLVRRCQSLIEMRTEEQNRLETPLLTTRVRISVETHIKQLTNELEEIDREINQLFDDYPSLRKQRDLLTSIPGIGETTAARILGEMPNIAEFRDVKAVVAYAGLSPRHYQSGSIRRSSRLAKTGNKKLRCALYFPAVCALRYNPIVKSLADRLEERGKAKMSIIAAAMRKLLVLAYGVLKSGQPFDAAYAAS
jgi:transposase